MKDKRGISRRECVLTAGGALVLTASARGLALDSGTVSFQELVRRCGTPRLIFSTQGGIAPQEMKARHGEQLAFLMSLCGVTAVKNFHSMGCTKQRNGQRVFTTWLSSVLTVNGPLVLVTTTKEPMASPILSLRGDIAGLHVFNGGVYFSHDVERICPWLEPENALPDTCLQSYSTVWESRGGDARYTDLAMYVIHSSHILSC